MNPIKKLLGYFLHRNQQGDPIGEAWNSITNDESYIFQTDTSNIKFHQSHINVPTETNNKSHDTFKPSFNTKNFLSSRDINQKHTY